ncbi:hypothetical protein ACFRQM_51085 [Streptomyces sp. NPDC056831]|uniref:hypothetical protein n=1 Tax=Streptomyces sp. NPDC056831 TaxID=3345954 RepID=UPI00367A13FE
MAPPRSKEKVLPPYGHGRVSRRPQDSESVFAYAPKMRIVPSSHCLALRAPEKPFT